MKFSLPRIRSRVQSALIFAVFLIFVANAVGLTSFAFSFGQDIAVNAQVAGDLLSGQFPGPLTRADFNVWDLYT